MTTPITQSTTNPSFTQELYDCIRTAIPDLTTRRFSRYCGMSEGYYGSITAQHLPISTNALIYLAEVLQQWMTTTDDYDGRTRQRLQNAQQMIAQEIAERTQQLPIENLSVRKMILSAVAKTAYARDHCYNLPAIIIG